MTNKLNIIKLLSIFTAVLLIAGCASAPETPAAAPATPEVTPEQPAVVEKAPEAAPAQAAAVEQPQAAATATQEAPVKKKVRKARKIKHKKVAPPPPPAPEPVVEKPAPEPAPFIAQPQPAPAVVTPPPPPPAVEEPGFLAKYWMWLVGVLVVIASMLGLWWRRNAE